jgi:hypothetical protein
MSNQFFTRAALALLFAFNAFRATAQTARVQVIHNSPNAPAVDVYLNNSKILPNVPFRGASGFLNAPAGVEFQVRIKGASANSDTTNPAFFGRYTLEANKGYYLVANGNLALPNGNYAANPGGISTGFDITVIPDARETSATPGNVDLRIMHSVTDAPAVDIKAQGVGTLVEDAPFRGFSNYIPVPAANYTIQIAPTTGSPNLLAYKAALAGLGGNTALVLASGYFNPAANTTGGTPGPGFGLWAFTPTGQAIQLPKAISRAQIVHNSPNAPAVDIFVNGAKAVPALAFRNATTFTNLDAGVPVVVSIKPASASSDTSNPTFRRVYELAGDEGYYLVANGNLALPNGNYAANPGGISTGFDITVIPGAKETSAVPANVDLRIMHSVTDAPAVDIKAQGVGTLVEDAPFRGFSNYIPVPAANYTIQIAPATGSPNLLAYKAALAGLGGNTALVLASGYFNPAANTTGGTPGPGFGLWAFTPTGQAIQLPKAISRVQIVHNSANAPTVDVFVNGGKAVPGLAFRKATPFVNLDAGVPLVVALKGASASNDTSNPAFRRVYELAGDESYSLVATGLLSTMGYAPNPEGRNRSFDITVMPGAREISSTSATNNNVDVRVLHGCTDAPKVDVRVQAGPTLVNNAGFRDFTPYLSAPNQDLVLEVTDSLQSGVVAAYSAPLTAFADSAIVVMASGFLTPGNNQNGPGFGLLAVTKSGNAILLPVFTSAANSLSSLGWFFYPNPNQGKFFLRVSGGEKVVRAEAIGLDGKTSIVSFSQEGDLVKAESRLQSGLYILKTSTQSGKILSTQMMVD